MVAPGEAALFPGAETLKALTLRRPWPSVILYGPKRVENRTWELPFRRDGAIVALHCGKAYDADDDQFIRERWPGGRNSNFQRPPAGLFFAVARLTPTRGPQEFIGSQQEMWAFGPFCYLISDMVSVEALGLEGRGSLGLWSVEPATAALLLKAHAEGKKL